MSNVFSNVAKSLFKRRVRCCCRHNCSNSLMSKTSCVVINNERCFDNYQVTDGVLLNQVKEKESLTFETIFCILACDTVENLQKEKKKNYVNKAVTSTSVTSSQLHVPNTVKF